MSAEREEKIREFRLKQPLDELERKADKARERSKLWSQEELDAATAQARDFTKWLGPIYT